MTDPSQAAVRRLWGAAFFMDAGLYFALTGVPYLALSMHAGPLVLGVLPMAYSLSYSLLSWRLPSFLPDRLRPARRTLFLTVACMTALMFVTSIPQVFCLLALVGVALAFYWPPLQSTIGDLSRPERLQRNIGVFNVSWSFGKGMGFISGGIMLELAGFQALFIAAAVTALAARLMISRVTGASPQERPIQEAVAIPPFHGAFRRASWAANFLAFGTVGLLNYHLPRHLESLGMGSAVFGLYLGLVMVTQTLLFVALGEHSGWRYRKALLFAVPVLVSAALLLVSLATGPAALLLTAPVLGAALGFAYFSSIYYSVRDVLHRGRNVGIHEACLALGSVVLPLSAGAAGHLAQQTRAPLMLGIAAGATALCVIAYFLMWGTRGAGNR